MVRLSGGHTDMTHGRRIAKCQCVVVRPTFIAHVRGTLCALQARSALVQHAYIQGGHKDLLIRKVKASHQGRRRRGGGVAGVLTPALLKTGWVNPPDSRMKWPKSAVFSDF